MNRNEAIRLVNVSEKCPKGEDAKAWFATRSDEDLFSVQKVVVNCTDLDAPGKPHSHVICAVCGEEVTDGREVQTGCGKAICGSCAGQAYYEMLQP